MARSRIVLGLIAAIISGHARAAGDDCPANPSELLSPFDPGSRALLSGTRPVYSDKGLEQQLTLIGGQQVVYKAEIFGERDDGGSCHFIESSTLVFQNVRLKTGFGPNLQLAEAVKLMRALPTRQLSRTQANIIFETGLDLVRSLPTRPRWPQGDMLQDGLRAALRQTPAIDGGSFFLKCDGSVPQQCLMWSHLEDSVGPGPTLSMSVEVIAGYK